MKTGTSSSLQSDQRVGIRIVISTVVIIMVMMLFFVLTFLTIKMTMMSTQDGDDSLDDNESAEVEFVSAVSAGGSVKSLPAV